MEERWSSQYIPALEEFIRVPNLTVFCDPEFLTNGLIQEAKSVVSKFAKALEIEGLSEHVVEEEGRPPMYIYLHEQADAPNLMFYGHLDKMPHCEGWEEPKHPTNPVTIGEWMFGRGSSDDGYAAFTVLLAMKAAQVQGKRLPRVCLVLETEEESGSDSLLFLLSKARDLTGVPDYCFCMDSGCMDYDRLWLTSSLRGVVNIDLKIEAAKTAYHSGEAGGVVPETFAVWRVLLDRLDDPATGMVHEDF